MNFEPDHRGYRQKREEPDADGGDNEIAHDLKADAPASGYDNWTLVQ